MIIVKGTTRLNGTDEGHDGNILLHGPVYVLNCEDNVGNQFEIETDESTYKQATRFLTALKEV